MNSMCLASGVLGDIWPILALMTLWLILMCLKTIGHGYYTAVCWHNLKVEAHRLRLKQKHDIVETHKTMVRNEAKRRGITVEDQREGESDESEAQAHPEPEAAKAA